VDVEERLIWDCGFGKAKKHNKLMDFYSEKGLKHDM
jgi:hypothetical protein